jgi:peptidoglycan/LPS O-acetylase OafA/YrhL
MWSVATEWQIYFFLPFVLLPIWRKFGMASTALCAFAIGLLPHFLLPPEHNFDWACPWYLGLFGLGMWGAELSYGKHWREGRRVPGAAIWNSACIVLMMGVVGAYMLLRDNWTPYSIFIDPFIGLAAMCLIVGCARASQDNSRRKYERAALSLFETRFAQWIGSFSYSLYLTHSLVFYSVGWLLDKALRLPTHIAVARYCALLPIMLAFGYVFYLLFERPTMRKKSVQTPDSISAPRA